jgi:uroporphyrinogen-III synthase
MSTGLAGVRVLVTRPAKQAQALARAIETAGGEAVRLPTIEFAEPSDRGGLEAALRALPHAAYAVFISTNAAERGLALLREHGGWPPALRFAAVGEATARVLQAAGIREVLAPRERFDSEALLELLPAEAVRGRAVLLFRGEGGRELLAGTLTARGAQVVAVVCYRRVPAAPDAAVLARLQRGEIDIVTVTSVEGLENLVALAGERARPRLLALPLLVTSDRQAEAARTLGFHGGIRVAARTGDTAILEALTAWRAAGNFL